MSLRMIFRYCCLTFFLNNLLGNVSERIICMKNIENCLLETCNTDKLWDCPVILKQISDFTTEKPTDLCASLRITSFQICSKQDQTGFWCVCCRKPGNASLQSICPKGLCQRLQHGSRNQDLTVLKCKLVLVSYAKFWCQCGDNDSTKVHFTSSSILSDGANGVSDFDGRNLRTSDKCNHWNLKGSQSNVCFTQSHILPEEFCELRDTNDELKNYTSWNMGKNTMKNRSKNVENERFLVSNIKKAYTKQVSKSASNVEKRNTIYKSNKNEKTLGKSYKYTTHNSEPRKRDTLFLNFWSRNVGNKELFTTFYIVKSSVKNLSKDGEKLEKLNINNISEERIVLSDKQDLSSGARKREKININQNISANSSNESSYFNTSSSYSVTSIANSTTTTSILAYIMELMTGYSLQKSWTNDVVNKVQSTLTDLDINVYHNAVLNKTSDSAVVNAFKKDIFIDKDDTIANYTSNHNISNTTIDNHNVSEDGDRTQHDDFLKYTLNNKDNIISSSPAAYAHNEQEENDHGDDKNHDYHESVKNNLTSDTIQAKVQDYSFLNIPKSIFNNVEVAYNQRTSFNTHNVNKSAAADFWKILLTSGLLNNYDNISIRAKLDEQVDDSSNCNLTPEVTDHHHDTSVNVGEDDLLDVRSHSNRSNISNTEARNLNKNISINIDWDKPLENEFSNSTFSTDDVGDNFQNTSVKDDYTDVTEDHYSNISLTTEAINTTVSVSEDEEFDIGSSSTDSTSTTTSTTTTPTTTTVKVEEISNSCENPCSSEDQYGVSWYGCPGTIVSLPCPQGASGEAKWNCESNENQFVGDMPDYSNCTHTWIEEIIKEIMARYNALYIARRMQEKSNTTSFFGHELPQMLSILRSTFILHLHQVFYYQSPIDRFTRSTLFTAFATAVAEKLLMSKNGWMQLTESQRVSFGLFLTNLSTSVGFALANLAAGLSEDFKYNVTFNNDTALMFGIDLRDANSSSETFVFPPILENSDSRIFVNVGVPGIRPRYVGMIMDTDPASLLFPPSRNNLGDTSNASKILNSKLISFSLQDINNGNVTMVETFHSQSVGNNSAVRVLFNHVTKPKGPKDTKVRRHLHQGELPTAVLGSGRCVFWNFNLGEAGLWDEAGCRVEFSGETHTLCICNHLSTFAVLMDVHDYVGKDVALEVLSWTCSGASVLCLLLTLIVFHGCRSIQCERTTIGKNLCVCLIAAHAAALFFLDKTYVDFSEVMCSLVAGALHYLFLAAFCWMTIEGHHLYRLVVRVFDSGRDFRRWYLMIGYGAPALVVTITKTVALIRDEKAYGRDELCWLSSPFYIWSFIGPVLLLTGINTAVVILALREAVFAGLSQGKSKGESVWIWIRGWFSLSALLGITWVFGLAFMELHHNFVYIFVVLNGCQGVFIFLFRCVLSEQVRNSVVSKVKRKGFVILLRDLAYRRSSWNVDSQRSDSTRDGSITGTGHSESVQHEGENHTLWYVLTHSDQETVSSCDLLQISIKETRRDVIADEGVTPNVKLEDCFNKDIRNSSCREESSNPNTRPTINVTNKAPDTSFFGSGNWRPSGDADERLGLSVFSGPCWSVLGSVRHVSVTRYPTIHEESDPDC